MAANKSAYRDQDTEERRLFVGHATRRILLGVDFRRVRNVLLHQFT